MKKTALILCLILIFVLSACSDIKKNDKLTVAVSIPPQAHFVKAVCKDKAEVITLIPAGASAESYEMSPKEITAFNQSDIYFSIGVPAEKNGILTHTNKNTKLFDLTLSVDEKLPIVKIGDERDPHIWLSPKRVMLMIEEIEQQLSNIDPENSEFYKTNAENYINKLINLDKQIQKLFTEKKEKVFYISHPSYGYLAADYGLSMISLENNGHEATPKDLTEIINSSAKSGNRVIFCQEEASKKQAELVAKEIGGRVEVLKPLSYDYTKELLRAATLIAEAMK